MADLDHEDDELLVLDIADDAVVANLVAPIRTEQTPLKWFSKASGVFVLGKPLFQKLFYAAANDGIEFVDRFPNGLTILNRPGHARTPRN
jgi:hypothetical protein